MAQTWLEALRNRILAVGRWSVLLCLFSVPINKPATNIFIFLALLCMLLGSQTQQRLREACQQPVVIGTIVWLLVLQLSALYAPPGFERWQALGVNVALLYPLIVAALLNTPEWRTRGMLAFGLSTSLVLLASWGQFIKLLPQREIALENPAFLYTVFKDYTQQGIEFLVLAAMALSFARVEENRRRKIVLWVIAALAVTDVMFLLQSRTSYLIVIPLLVFWVWRLLGGPQASWKRLALGMLVLLACASITMMTPRVHERLLAAQQDLSRYADSRQATSLGIRLELWRRTLPIIASAPIIGHGLGQWDILHTEAVKDFKDYDGFRMHHPHQEELLILSEEGMVGLAIFLTLLVCLARYIRRLPQPQHDFYASLLLIYLTGGLANCLWADFSHRHVFIMLLACIPFVATSKTPNQAATNS